ncbi:zinc finger protein 232-like isoform X2 [Solea solea]|uniref:zinc finger protein 232-like isoform X2 n=1 Tax=Solea solea TaxID=90069 RepID=UPI00272D2530|nr:zinc finger protein 232-like isoform X2 [Solea solea]
MCKIGTLRTLLNERLSAAVEEIFKVLETTLSEYEDEIERQRKLLEDGKRPVNNAEFAPVLAIKQEQLQEPEPLHIKEEQEEVWSIQKGEQYEGLVEDNKADITNIPFVTVSVESEDDKEEAKSPEVHQRPTVENTEEESAEQQMFAGSENETDNSDDELKRESTTQQGSTYTKPKEIHIIVEKSIFGKKKFSCSKCGKHFTSKGTLQRHIRAHNGDRPFSCSHCGKRFSRKQHLQEHVLIHTGEQPFSCSVCGKKFRFSAGMRKHRRTHKYNC